MNVFWPMTLEESDEALIAAMLATAPQAPRPAPRAVEVTGPSGERVRVVLAELCDVVQVVDPESGRRIQLPTGEAVMVEASAFEANP